MRFVIFFAILAVGAVALLRGVTALRLQGAPATDAGGGPGAPAAAKKTEWQLSVSQPSSDGSRSVLASLAADAPIASGFSQVTPKLVLRYRSGQTIAYVAFDTFLGDEAVDALVAVGNAPAVHQKWALSADGRTAFVPGDALAFIRQLQKVDSFSLRLERPNHPPISVSFTPVETDLVIKALFSAGVKYGG